MNTERDPRVDPRPGDVLEIASHVFRVIERGRLGIWIEDRRGDQYPIVGLRWGTFAKEARVVARGQEDRDGS